MNDRALTVEVVSTDLKSARSFMGGCAVLSNDEKMLEEYFNSNRKAVSLPHSFCRRRRTNAWVIGVLFAIVLATGAVTPVVAAPAALVIDVPHGGCRLVVRENGAGEIAFGAVYKRVAVADGTFDFKQLMESLRASSYRPDDETMPLPTQASVFFSATNELRFITEPSHVKGLLAMAWAARALPNSLIERSDHRWIAQACGFRDRVVD